MSGVLKRYDPPGLAAAPSRHAGFRRTLTRIALALIVGFDWQVVESRAWQRRSDGDSRRPLSSDELMMLHLIPRA